LATTADYHVTLVLRERRGAGYMEPLLGLNSDRRLVFDDIGKYLCLNPIMGEGRQNTLFVLLFLDLASHYGSIEYKCFML
jgi:hypothetical protein